jgi:hypothetical protein
VAPPRGGRCRSSLFSGLAGGGLRMNRAVQVARNKERGIHAEILHIVDCPSWGEAGRRLRAALDWTGHQDTVITFTIVMSHAAATKVPFAGSPTILIDGTDLFPSDGRTSGLACRVYMTPAGFAGQPTQEQLQKALTSRG